MICYIFLFSSFRLQPNGNRAVLVDDIMEGLRKLADKLGDDAWMWEDDGKGARMNQKDLM